MLLGSETALLRMSHVLLGKIVGRYELGMEVQSRRSWDAGSRLGHDKGVQINISPISEVIVTEPSNVCIRTVLHECILTICTSHAALSETRANQCLCEVLFLILVWLSVESKNQKPNIPLIQSLRCQLVPTNRRGFAPRLLCMGSLGCTFAIPLCCWKNTPWKQESLGMEWFSSVLWQFFCLILV